MSSALTNVVHVTSWLSRAGGGIPPVIWSLAQQMELSGINCSVAGLQDQWNGVDIPDTVPVVTGAITGPASLGYSGELVSKLAPLVRSGSVVHTHGLWMHPGVAARQSSRRARCPLMISPHGMLEPWALQNSRWKKRLASWWFEDQNLRSAHCLHALCQAEARSIRSYGLRNPIAIIPNAIDAAEMETPEAEIGKAVSRKRIKLEGLEPGRKILLFLSRLHPKKGLENLLPAWARQQQAKEWVLVIAGAGEPAYEQQLRRLVIEYSLERTVLFCGSVYGEDKKQLLAAADAFVLPSFSEGFSMAILEAAASGLPVLLTPECNFPELAAADAALVVAPEATAIETGLNRLLALTDEERKQMGNRGRALVRESYTWPVVADKMLAVYRWLAGAGPKPACVT